MGQARESVHPPAVYWLTLPVAGGLTAFFWHIGADLLVTVAGALAALCTVMGVLVTWRNIRRDRLLARAAQPSGNYARLGFAELPDLSKAGLTALDDAVGVFVGVLDGVLLFFPAGHCLTIAMTGAGKTSSLVFPNVLHILNVRRLGKSLQALVVNDKGGEVTATLWPFIREIFPAAYCVNPWHSHGLPNHCVNLIQRIVDHAVDGSAELIDVIRQIALVLVPEPEKAGENLFFIQRARIIIQVLLRGMSWLAAHGQEEICNLVELRRRITCSAEEHIGYLAEMRDLGGEMGREADRLLGMLEATPMTYENALAEAENATWIFSEDGPLAESIQDSDFRARDVIERSGYVGIIIPPIKYKTYATYVALLLQEFGQAGLDHGRIDRGVRILADELGLVDI